MKRAAKIYAANVIYNSMGTGADTDLFQDGERDFFCQQLHLISEHINKGVTAPSIDDAVSAAINGKDYKIDYKI